MIRKFHLDARNEPLVPLAEKVLIDGKTLDGDDYGLNVDAPYQREAVWGVERKRNLIKSLLMGLPIGIITLSERRYPEWKAVVDGKQRLLAVRGFITNEFSVPAGWFGPDLVSEFAAIASNDDPLRYADLNETGKRIFDNAAIVQTATAHGLTVDQEEELFDLVNYGGVPQGEKDV